MPKFVDKIRIYKKNSHFNKKSPEKSPGSLSG
jgi:hypothetical protein